MEIAERAPANVLRRGDPDTGAHELHRPRARTGSAVSQNGRPSPRPAHLDPDPPRAPCSPAWPRKSEHQGPLRTLGGAELLLQLTGVDLRLCPACHQPALTRTALPLARSRAFLRGPHDCRNSADGDDEVSRVPGEPSRACPALRPRRDRCARPSGSRPYPCSQRRCLPRIPRRRLPRLGLSRGSITRPARSLSTTRSRGRPRTTQDSVPAGGPPWPGGSRTRWVPA
jgi:hypothetical protein